MARPRLNGSATLSASEKSKRYRENKKQKATASEVALEIVAYLEQEKVALLNHIKSHTDRGRVVEIRHRGSMKYTEFVVKSGHGSFRFDEALYHYLVMTETIQFVKNGESWLKETIWQVTSDNDRKS